MLISIQLVYSATKCSAQAKLSRVKWTHENLTCVVVFPSSLCFPFSSARNSLEIVKTLCSELHCIVSCTTRKNTQRRERLIVHWKRRQTRARRKTRREHVTWEVNVSSELHLLCLQLAQSNWIPKIFWNILMRNFNKRQSDGSQHNWVELSSNYVNRELHCVAESEPVNAEGVDDAERGGANLIAMSEVVNNVKNLSNYFLFHYGFFFQVLCYSKLRTPYNLSLLFVHIHRKIYNMFN